LFFNCTKVNQLHLNLSLSPRRQCRMVARSQFFVTVFAEKQIQRAAPKICYCHPPEFTLHNRLLWSWQKAHKPIMYKAFQASKHCLHLPILPTPPTILLLQAIVLSLLVPSSLFRHLSAWQVRSFVDTSFVGDHSFPRTKAKPPTSAQLSRSASPASLQGCLHCVVIHRRLRPITFATTQQQMSLLQPSPGFAFHLTYA
jgi:hypothetical protein